MNILKTQDDQTCTHGPHTRFPSPLVVCSSVFPLQSFSGGTPQQNYYHKASFKKKHFNKSMPKRTEDMLEQSSFTIPLLTK
jgi:hypothetical protein